VNDGADSNRRERNEARRRGGLGQPHRALERGRRPQPRLVNRQGVGLAHDHGALDDVLELSHVARPCIGLEQRERAWVDPADHLAGLLGIAIDEVLRQQADIRRPLAQRRHADRKHVDAVVEVAAERPRGNRRLEVAVGRGDDAHVGANRGRSADPLELALLQHAQEGHLGLERQLSDLVEEERPARRHFEAAHSPLHGPGECSSLVSEQLRGDERRRRYRAVDADERAVGAQRLSMNRAGDELLPGAGLARDEDRGIRPRDLGHPRLQRAQRRRLPDETTGHPPGIRPIARPQHLLRAPVMHMILPCGSVDRADRVNHDGLLSRRSMSSLTL
jgi:hypothetical protein